MAIAIRSVTVGTNNGSSATVSATTPGDTQVGDLLVFIHCNDFYTLADMPTPTVTGSPTITSITDAIADGGSGLAHIKSYWAVANTAGANTVSVTETGAANEEKAMVVYVLTGADTTTPIDDAANNTGASTNLQVAPAVTTATDDAFLILHVNSGGGGSAAAYTSPGDVTEQYEIHVGGLSGVGAIKQLAASGGTGTFTFDTGVQNTPYAAVTIAVITAEDLTQLDVPSIDSTATLGAPTVSATGSVTLSPPSIGSGETLGTPTVSTTGSVSLSPPSIPSGSTLGSPALSSSGTATLQVPSIDSTATLGEPSVSLSGAGVDDSVYPVADALLQCLCAQLVLVPNPPEICCIRTGTQVSANISLTDDECCRGLAWVRVVSIFPSEQNFPEADTQPRGNCPPQWFGVVLELGVIRCAPYGTARTFPDCTDWTTVSQNVMNDAQAMRRAICCLDVDDAAKIMGPWEAIANEGACTGGTMTVTVQVPNCDDC